MKNTHETGNVGEMRVAYEATKRGYAVSVPIGHDTRYDLVVERQGTLERIQVKTVNSDGCVVKAKCRSVGKKDGKVIAKFYSSDDIDWLVVFDLHTDTCAFVPSSMLGEGRYEIALRYVPAKNNQQKKVHWFKDYVQW